LAGIGLALDWWNVWWCDLLGQEQVPIDRAEPRMCLDLFGVGQTELWIADQQLFEHVLGIVVDRLGDIEFGRHDLLVHLLNILRVEWRLKRFAKPITTQ
jgi:hypothetical protein